MPFVKFVLVDEALLVLERVERAPNASICRFVWSCMNREYVDKLRGGGGDMGMDMVYESWAVGIVVRVGRCDD